MFAGTVAIKSSSSSSIIRHRLGKVITYRHGSSAWKNTLQKVRFLTTKQQPADHVMDVVIVGGGAVGCTMALQLNQLVANNNTSPSLKVGLLEARDAPPPSPKQQQQQQPSSTPSKTPHPRSYALSPTSLKLLGDKTLSQLELGYYDSMQVWQANSPASLTFTSRDLDADPLKAPYLGAVVEDQPIVSSLWSQIEEDDNTKCFTNTTISSIVDVGDEYNNVRIITNNNEIIDTSLLIAADGANSFIRKSCGINRIGTEYDQHALTFTVEIDNSSMNKRAFQRFLSDGSIMALLPTYSSNHAIVVWSTTPMSVQQWKNESIETLIDYLNECLMDGPQRIPPLLEQQQQDDSSSSSSTSPNIVSNVLYGAERVLDTIHYGLAMASHHPYPKFYAPPKINTIVSPRLSFPLSCYQSTTYTKGRIALIGDAAHTVHPMAGQGLNIGLGDVQELINVIKKSHISGMDLITFLNEYNTNRLKKVSLSLGGIHTLQKLFSNQQQIPLQHAKTFGMNILQNVGPLRRQIAMAAAYGL